MINDILDALGFKEEEAKTYLSLLDIGSSSGGELAKSMGVPRPTVYGYLDKLVIGGLVTQSTQRGVKIFTAESGEKLRILYKRKIDELRLKEKQLDLVIPELEKQAGMNLFRPKLQFYEGREGIHNLLEDMFQYNDIDSYVFWPIVDMIDVITPEFLSYHNKTRIQKNITLRSIWLDDQARKFNNPPFLGTGERYLREIRIAPYDMGFNMGCWFYANKATFISSRAERFGFLVESAELVEMLKAQHNVMWQISKPHPIHPKGADIFFDEFEHD